MSCTYLWCPIWITAYYLSIFAVLSVRGGVLADGGLLRHSRAVVRARPVVRVGCRVVVGRLRVRAPHQFHLLSRLTSSTAEALFAEALGIIAHHSIASSTVLARVRLARVGLYCCRRFRLRRRRYRCSCDLRSRCRSRCSGRLYVTQSRIPAAGEPRSAKA